MDTAATSPKAQSAADRVYTRVRADILSRRYADHDLLSEGAIALEGGVSRTPVREALLRLEAEGMVRLLPKRGALVLPVSAQEWRDVIDTRVLLETHGVTVVIEAGRGQQVADLLAGHLDRLRAAAAAEDVVDYVGADRDFHATIVAGAGNAILTRLYSTLRDRQLLMGATNLLARDGRLDLARARATVADHVAIAEAIRAADLPTALQLTRTHLASAERMLRDS